MSDLERYWIELEPEVDAPWPLGTREGIGVTARDERAAISAARARFEDGRVLSIRSVTRGVEVTDLCPWLVLPNMRDWNDEGIWFPIAGSRQSPVRRRP